MFHSRRNTDAVYKKQIIETSKVIADVMLKHLSVRDHGL
jgi:E3 ubiquitin-protein ligase HUWE1